MFSIFFVKRSKIKSLWEIIKKKSLGDALRGRPQFLFGMTNLPCAFHQEIDSVGEGYWGGGISIISQNFSKSPSILFHPLDSSISQTSPYKCNRTL
jgi:hypothetical protein